VHAAAFTLGDDSAPSAGGASGSLTEPGAVSGTINFTAQDTWSGIFRASLLVDGQPIVSSTPNENGGRCVTLGLAGATRDFNYRRPCPATQQVELALPPGSMVAGRHELRVTVEDAAGNTATAFGPRRVDVTKEQATASSTATARFIPDKSGSFITTFGMSKRIAGKLVDAAGSPIPASAVEVEMTSDSAVRRRSVRRLTTGSDGRWAITVPGTASRKVEFTHVATGASLEKRVKVRSRIQLRAARSRVAAFGRMRLIGRLPSEKARRGASVEIQARGPRGWRTVSVRRLARSGRFAMTYRFRRTAHAKFRFRAVVRASSDLTVTPQRSRTVRVRVG
jgi:hypothetical protein